MSDAEKREAPVAPAADIDEEIALLHQAATAARVRLPEAIANHVVSDFYVWHRDCRPDRRTPKPILDSARAILTLPAPAEFRDHHLLEVSVDTPVHVIEAVNDMLTPYRRPPTAKPTEEASRD